MDERVTRAVTFVRPFALNGIQVSSLTGAGQDACRTEGRKRACGRGRQRVRRLRRPVGRRNPHDEKAVVPNLPPSSGPVAPYRSASKRAANAVTSDLERHFHE